MTALLVLHNDAMREKAVQWIKQAPKETRVTFQGPKRSLPQNDKLHAMLTELASKIDYDGVKLSMDDYKLVFMDALNKEVRLVRNLSKTGFVNLDRRTAKLSKEEFAQLIEIVYAYAAERGVELSEGR